MTLVIQGRTASDCLALEAMVPTMYSLEGPIILVLENAVEVLETSVEEVETAVEVVVGSVRPPQVYEEMGLQPFH